MIKVKLSSISAFLVLALQFIFSNALLVENDYINYMNKSLPYHSSISNATVSDINNINAQVRPKLLSIVNSDFFKFFKLNLFSECPFWDDNNGFCTNRACAVDIIEDGYDSLPDYWKPEFLGKIDDLGSLEKQPIDVQDEFLNQLCNKKFLSNNPYSPLNCRDIDYCDVDYITNHPDAVLVDLTANPERFTGYGGEQSGLIWKSIYSENCFQTDDKNATGLAQEVFYKLISGMHASIGIHLSNDYLDVETGKWGPNLDLFMFRVGNWTERLENIYFNYAIVAKSIKKISPYLKNLEFCSQYDQKTLDLLGDISGNIDTSLFKENLIFDTELSSEVKDQFRIKFKNVTKIMDCVHCDRCRLWGKVQSTGYATSLKILLEMDNDPMFVVNSLTKYELIALLNTFDRISKSVQLINDFEVMFNEKYNEEYKKKNSFVGKALGKLAQITKGSEQQQNDDNTQVDYIVPEDDGYEINIKLDEIKTTFTNSWHSEVNEVKKALMFILRSYVDFPKNLYRLFIIKVNEVYNKFIY